MGSFFRLCDYHLKDFRGAVIGEMMEGEEAGFGWDYTGYQMRRNPSFAVHTGEVIRRKRTYSHI